MPARAELTDVRGADTLRMQLSIDDALATDTRRARVERADGLEPRALVRPWFIQMAGEAVLSGRVHGRVMSGRGRGFFETYR